MTQFSLFDSPLDLAFNFWKNLLSSNDIVIDATCGHGHDAFKVLSLIPDGFLYGIDIQKQACINTTDKLASCFSNFEIFCQSHACFPNKIKQGSIKLIIYNLGYLPKTDKTLTTLKDSTLESLHHALDLLMPSGALSIMCYIGHEQGAQEEKEIMKWASILDKTNYLVTYHTLINRLNAPALCLVQKKANCLSQKGLKR